MTDEVKKKRFKVPHTYVIICIIILIMAVLTYVVPAGSYERVKDEVTGRTVVDPDTFQYVDSNPVKPFDLFKDVTLGMQAVSDIIFFMFIISGSFNIIISTGALESGISRVAVKFRNSGIFLIPIVICIFAVFGFTIGMAEETIIFVTLGVMLARALGYDAVVGTAMILLGAACGFTCGALNPFTVGVAQGLAELPIFSGIAFRFFILAVMIVVTSWYIMRYAKKVKDNPELSIVADLEKQEAHKALDLSELPELTTRHVLVLLALAAGFISIVVGVFNFGWYMDEIATAFLITGLAGGIIGGYGPSTLAEKFVAGAKDIVFGALVVGLARVILLVMQDGLILDTIVHGLSQVVLKLPKGATAMGMYVVQSLINYLIPSGSGQAAATMPIMVPLADVVGMNRQIAVLAFQFGDGFSNLLWPTGFMVIACAMAKIPLSKYYKWLLPFYGLCFIVQVIFLEIAVAIGYN